MEDHSKSDGRMIKTSTGTIPLNEDIEPVQTEESKRLNKRVSYRDQSDILAEVTRLTEKRKGTINLVDLGNELSKKLGRPFRDATGMNLKAFLYCFPDRFIMNSPHPSITTLQLRNISSAGAEEDTATRRAREYRKVCRYYLQGHCKHDACPFVHERPADKKAPATLCKFFKSSECWRGRSCPFLHDDDRRSSSRSPERYRSRSPERYRSRSPERYRSRSRSRDRRSRSRSPRRDERRDERRDDRRRDEHERESSRRSRERDETRDRHRSARDDEKDRSRKRTRSPEKRESSLSDSKRKKDETPDKNKESEQKRLASESATRLLNELAKEVEPLKPKETVPNGILPIFESQVPAPSPVSAPWKEEPSESPKLQSPLLGLTAEQQQRLFILQQQLQAFQQASQPPPMQTEAVSPPRQNGQSEWLSQVAGTIDIEELEQVVESGLPLENLSGDVLAYQMGVREAWTVSLRDVKARVQELQSTVNISRAMGVPIGQLIRPFPPRSFLENQIAAERERVASLERELQLLKSLKMSLS